MQQKITNKGIGYATSKEADESQRTHPSSDEAVERRNKSLYLDIYRDGKRTYEYLKMYIIPETDNNARKRNQATMDAANAIKSKRIIELTNGEAGIENSIIRIRFACRRASGRI